MASLRTLCSRRVLRDEALRHGVFTRRAAQVVGSLKLSVVEPPTTVKEVSCALAVQRASTR